MTASLIETGKRVLPRPVKDAGRSALRAAGTLTSPARPLPDFLIVGTKRGGTTSMWNYLLTHPAVLPMFPAAENLKSPHYFYWHHDRGERWYRSHFATTFTRRRVARRTGGTVVAGEASPYYMYDPRVAARVRVTLPQVRVVMMLRDPVERAYSHYKERVRAGVEKLSFEDALAAEEGRLAGELARMSADPSYYSRPHDHYSYRDRGVYLPQVRRWFDVFDPSQVLVVLSEDFYTDPAGVFTDVTDFLGLARHELRDAKRWNYRPAPGMPQQARRELTHFYAPHNAALAELLGRHLPWGVDAP